jgi:hypothetical protein
MISGDPAVLQGNQVQHDFTKSFSDMKTVGYWSQFVNVEDFIFQPPV